MTVSAAPAATPADPKAALVADLQALAVRQGLVFERMPWGAYGVSLYAGELEQIETLLGLFDSVQRAAEETGALARITEADAAPLPAPLAALAAVMDRALALLRRGRPARMDAARMLGAVRGPALLRARDEVRLARTRLIEGRTAILLGAAERDALLAALGFSLRFGSEAGLITLDMPSTVGA